ncbi:hypothetical protein ABPG75_001722 [Micractinium tetrahymenae]
MALAPALQDALAAHSGDKDPFAYHVKEAPVAGTVAELTDVAAEFTAAKPSHDKLATALDVKDRLAAHGVHLPEEEAVWREEFEEGVEEAVNS